MSNSMLGYYSFTNWILEPSMILLEGQIVMNRVVYDEVILKGEDRISSYDYLKGELLNELHSKKLVKKENYKIPEDEKVRFDERILSLITEKEDDINRLCIDSYKFWIEYQKVKLIWLKKDEPARERHIKHISNWKKHLITMETHGITEDDKKHVCSRYLQEIFYTFYLSDRYNLKVQEWEDYSNWQKFVLKDFLEKHYSYNIQKEGKRKLETTRKLFNLAVPQVRLDDVAKIDQYIECYEALSNLRKLVDDIDSSFLKENYWFSEERDSNDYLSEQINLISEDLKSILEEKNVLTKRYTQYTTILTLPLAFFMPVEFKEEIGEYFAIKKIIREYLEWLSASCTLKGSAHGYPYISIFGSAHRAHLLISQSRRSNLHDRALPHLFHIQIS